MGPRNNTNGLSYLYDWKKRNVITHSVGFMLVFTATQTMAIIQATVFDSVQEEDSSFTFDPYVSLGIINLVYAVSNWLAPPFISVLTAKWTMVLGSLPLLAMVGDFIAPRPKGIYIMSALFGIGYGLIWTAQGNFLTLVSNPEHNERDWGIFWTIYQTSYVVGNLLVFIQFTGATIIARPIRQRVFVGLLVLGVAGVLIFVFGTRAVRDDAGNLDSSPHKAAKKKKGPWRAFKAAWMLLLTRDMALLSVTCFYTGIEMGFLSGVYSSAFGFTEAFGEDRAKYVGVSGILIGFGEICGGLLFTFGGERVNARGRTPAILLAAMSTLTASLLAFLTLPAASVLHTTDEKAFIPSRLEMALAASFLLGFGDACIQTQLCSIMSALYPEDSASPFAIFQFFQASAAGVVFFYSTYLDLYSQLAILCVTCVLGTVSSIFVVFTHKELLRAG